MSGFIKILHQNFLKILIFRYYKKYTLTKWYVFGLTNSAVRKGKEKKTCTFNPLFEPTSLKRYQYSWIPTINDIEIPLVSILISLVHPFSNTVNDLFYPNPKEEQCRSHFLGHLWSPAPASLDNNQRCSFMSGSLFLQWKHFPSNQNLSSEEIFHCSRSTVRSSSSLLIIIEAIAPSLNSKEVPPSTTMQASQQRERTHTLSRKKQLIKC